MQIKRFEARNMSEALKMIKKEFGEEAVILSARNNRPGRSIFGRRRTKGVVVTAAVDHQAGRDNLQTGRDPGMRSAPDRDRGKRPDVSDRGGTGRIIHQFKPITPTGQRIWQLRSASGNGLSGEASVNRQLYRKLVSQGVEEKLAESWSRQSDKLVDQSLPLKQQLQRALVQLLAAQGIVVTMADSRRRKKAGLVVMVGPAGAGKTTMVAKLAVGHLLEKSGTCAMISLDDSKVGGSYELEAYGRATGIRVLKAYDGRQLERGLAEVEGCRQVYVDTPAVRGSDARSISQLRRMLAKLPSAVIYLAICATARQDVIAKWIELYRPLGIEAVVVTRLDECSRIGHVVNLLVKERLPVAYLSNGPSVPEDCSKADAQAVARFLLPGDHERQEGDRKPEAGLKHDRSGQYVANRNSDIFHRHDCKAVKRINQDNMVFFDDQFDALGQGFKPCRMCCSELVDTVRFSRNLYAAGAR